MLSAGVTLGRSSDYWEDPARARRRSLTPSPTGSGSSQSSRETSSSGLRRARTEAWPGLSSRARRKVGSLASSGSRIIFYPISQVCLLTLSRTTKEETAGSVNRAFLPFCSLSSSFFALVLLVRETLNFAAALRLPRSVSENERRAIVDQTIEELGLRDAADTIVGGALRKGISGGERRRLSIGCVLVTLPSVLLLDEPTSGENPSPQDLSSPRVLLTLVSGLDAFTAHLLLETLSRLAKRNRTIIISLHAPRSDAFSLLDRLILLSKGDVVYSGKTADSLEWFHERGWDVEKGTNPLGGSPVVQSHLVALNMANLDCAVLQTSSSTCPPSTIETLTRKQRYAALCVHFRT